MTLVDSSAWIEYLRDTGSLACLRVDELLEGGDIAICDPVRMEILAGARDESQLSTLRRFMSRATGITVQPSDYDNAAALYRRCRQNGITIRSQIDCLIAAVAIRAQIPILHHDSDFTALARHTNLTTDPASL